MSHFNAINAVNESAVVPANTTSGTERIVAEQDLPVVLVAAIHSDHARLVRACADAWGQACKVVWTNDGQAAVRRAVLSQPVLVIVDHQIDNPDAEVLVRQLARLCPSSEAFVFQERGSKGTSPKVVADHYWDELPMMMRAWHERGGAEKLSVQPLPLSA